MTTLDKYAPSFYGKDTDEKLNIWNKLFSEENYAELLFTFKPELRDYIAELRKAEILEYCQIANAALSRLSAHFQWDESYTTKYCLDVVLAHSTDNKEDFRAYALGQVDVRRDWVQQELSNADIGNWELGYDPAEVNVICLKLRKEVKRQNEPAETLTKS